jgi:hypothetical protein
MGFCLAGTPPLTQQRVLQAGEDRASAPHGQAAVSHTRGAASSRDGRRFESDLTAPDGISLLPRVGEGGG